MKATSSLAATTSNHHFQSMETIYFGGGTPSLLPPDCITRILHTLSSSFGGISQNAEVTLEMDPGTFDLSVARQIKESGINRVSLGVQSFDDSILKGCGRAHSSADVENALQLLQTVGFENISLDLISSLPNLTLELWANTLDKAVEISNENLSLTHISVYDLQVEEKTAFGRWYTPGSFPLPSNEESALMYNMAVHKLNRAGFEHYEVSNYAKNGRRSRHNQQYWKCAPFWGFGLGAASFLCGERYTRPNSLSEYLAFVNQVEMSARGLPQKDSSIFIESLTKNRNSNTIYGGADALEVIMLSLRTSDGLDYSQFERVFGKVQTFALFTNIFTISKQNCTHKNMRTCTPFHYKEMGGSVVEALDPFRQRGLVEFKFNTENDNLTLMRLTESGFIISNEIISSVFANIS